MMALHRRIDQAGSDSRNRRRQLVAVYPGRTRGHDVVLRQMSRFGSNKVRHNLGRRPRTRVDMVF